MHLLPKGPVTKGLALKEDKVCNCCGEIHVFVPADAPFVTDMFWWDCQCQSTLVVTQEHLNVA